MRNEDDHSEKVIDNEQKDNLDIIKQDDHKDDGDKGDDHAGVKEPEAPPVLPERVDIVLAQDLSQSLGDDLGNLQDPFLTNLDANLAAGGATDAAYGIISFIDSPLPEEGCGLATDRIYNTNQAVTEDVATAQAGLAGLAIRGGLDAPEAQLVALQQVALQAEDQIGFRPDAERFVVLSTDDPFHQAGDYVEGGPNNNNTNLADGTGSGGVEDYPSIAQVAEDLAAANLTPIFAVQPDDTVPDAFDELQIYADLLADLNAVDPSIGGSVVTLSNDSSDLANVILAGLEHATISDMLMS